MSFTRSNSILQGEKNAIDRGIVQLRYTDVLGKFLAKYVFGNKQSFESLFKNGIGLDGSSVRGFSSIEESDMLLIPDRSTIRIFPTSLLSLRELSHSRELLAVIADVYQGF